MLCVSALSPIHVKGITAGLCFPVSFEETDALYMGSRPYAWHTTAVVRRSRTERRLHQHLKFWDGALAAAVGTTVPSGVLPAVIWQLLCEGFNKESWLKRFLKLLKQQTSTTATADPC